MLVPDGAITGPETDPFRAALIEDTETATDLPDPDQTVTAADLPLDEDLSPDETADAPEGDALLPDPVEEEAPADPTLYRGSAANDRILLDPAYTRIDGGDGTDMVVVNGALGEARILFGADNEILLDPGPDAPALTLENIERLAFDDGMLAFDSEGLAGQAYRLYQACFDRTPDAEGLGFWIKQLDAGSVTLTEAAGYFIGSSEFASVYGSPDELADVHYLALLYANVLNRVPDQDGFAFWRDQQKKGITRADMLVHFSESAENKALVSEAIDDGIWYL